MLSNKDSVLCLAYFLILLPLTKGTAEVQELKPPAADFNKHSIVQPIVQHARTKREIFTTRDTSGAHHSEVTMRVPIDGEEYILDLRLNQDLITDNHVLSYEKNGKTVTDKFKKKVIDLCHYGGSVRDKPGSWVALSTCHGVQGIVFDGQRMKYIEPAQGGAITSQHYLYDHGDLLKTYRCGHIKNVTNHSRRLEKELQNSMVSRYKRYAIDTQVREPYNANKRSRYVELVLVADHRIFQANGNDLRTVHRQMKTIANIINSVYSSLNIFIALVGVVVWNEYDKIRLYMDSNKSLNNFLQYREAKLVQHIPNDNAQLLTGQDFLDSVVGKGTVGSMCSSEKSGAVSNNHTNVIGLLAMTMAHELGHNFGMEHDTEEECKCPGKKCIMSSSSNDITPSHWSSCSLEYLTLSFSRGLDFCLRNKPERLFESPTCGNGFVEPGEQCDCGTKSDTHTYNLCHTCCDPSTCMLRANATCGAGMCCDLQTCRFKAIGTVCRSAELECDLPEYCSGHSEYCPDNLYKMDTTPCGKGEESAYCVRGKCRSHSDQCRLLWGTTGKSGHNICYGDNMLGNGYGNCGYDRQQRRYSKCAEHNIMCGALQCTHVDTPIQVAPTRFTSFTMTHTVIDSIIKCHVVDIDMGLNEVNLGMVPDGAKCGPDKMCMKQRCVSVAAVRETIANGESSVCPSNCSRHGVCNSAGHCHCDPGFAPPLCTLPGSGGSDESGPATDPSIQRNLMIALYVIFLGIVPAILLVLFLIYYFHPNVFKRCNDCQRKLRTRNSHFPVHTSNNVIPPAITSKIYANIEFTKIHQQNPDDIANSPKRNLQSIPECKVDVPNRIIQNPSGGNSEIYANLPKVNVKNVSGGISEIYANLPKVNVQKTSDNKDNLPNRNVRKIQDSSAGSPKIQLQKKITRENIVHLPVKSLKPPAMISNSHNKNLQKSTRYTKSTGNT